ncbi:hypothetical protein TgHK011_007171 [Trichoderma gracile]|nr:hypothetical protein TgHK011_007171 [Trichoderma gracile]
MASFEPKPPPRAPQVKVQVHTARTLTARQTCLELILSVKGPSIQIAVVALILFASCEDTSAFSAVPYTRRLSA